MELSIQEKYMAATKLNSDYLRKINELYTVIESLKEVIQDLKYEIKEQSYLSSE